MACQWLVNGLSRLQIAVAAFFLVLPGTSWLPTQPRVPLRYTMALLSEGIGFFYMWYDSGMDICEFLLAFSDPQPHL
jgi:hypothetical protein